MSVSESKLAIGFDRYIEKDWLEQVASWAAEGKTCDQTHALADDYLASFIHGPTSLRKTKNVLFGVWLNTSDKNSAFKEQGIRLLNTCSKDERLVIHWGLAVASYPFFASLARLTGRLLRLQGDIHSKELIRRSIEQYGDKESVRRATTRLLQSFAEWGVLMPASEGIFHCSPKFKLVNPELVTWLMASVFFSSERSRFSADEILSDPVWFPFDIAHNSFQVSRSLLLKIVHQAGWSVLISLRK